MTTNLTGNRTTSILKALFFCLAFTGLLACLSPLKHLLPLRFERLAYGIIGTIAALFALYHVAGGQSWFSACLGPGVWSFVFGLAMIMSRGIALPTGLHLGVNFILAAIGQQTGFASLWNIQSRTESALPQQAESIGKAMQIFLLLVTVTLMEVYRRRKTNIEPVQQRFYEKTTG